MTLPRSVADVVAEHVVFEVECIDMSRSRSDDSPAGPAGGQVAGTPSAALRRTAMSSFPIPSIARIAR
jgi:hypothetical protein